MHRQPYMFILLLLTAGPFAFAQEKPSPTKHTWKVGDTTREGLIFLPTKNEKEGDDAKNAPRPLVFGFHGHGGTAGRMTRVFAIQEHWPEAIVVYLQGIEGVTSVRDPKGERTGWQMNPGDLDDRDLKFFDVVLKDIRAKHNIDDKRIYAMGHSNGSRFTNLLWAKRGDTFAAVALSGSMANGLIGDMKPLPVFVIAGKEDPIVPYAGQARSIEAYRKILGTDESKAKGEGTAKLEPGREGMELGTFIHSGGHGWPKNASQLIVKFFQRHTRREADRAD